MQRARLAVRPHAVVIEDPVGNVRVLLNFAQHHAGAYRVRGSGGNENGVACVHRHTRETILHCAISDRAAKRFARHLRQQTHAQRGVFAGRNHVPHLRLPDSARGRLMLLRVHIVGMHLHGKFFLREDKLHKQRDARQASQARAGPFLWQGWPHFPKSASGKFAAWQSGTRCPSARPRRWVHVRGSVLEKVERDRARPRCAARR